MREKRKRRRKTEKNRRKKTQPLVAVYIHHIFVITMFGLYFKVQVSNGISTGWGWGGGDS